MLDRTCPQRDRVVILVNPRAGSASPNNVVSRLAELLTQQGLQTQISTDLDQATALAGQWQAEDRLRALLGVGGDGTAAALVNRTPPGTPIALLPAGTENLLARHMGLPSDPQRVAQTILDGRVRPLDAGLASGRLFLIMASAGFDADVVQRLHGARQGHILGRLSYVGPILKSMFAYAFPEIRVSLDPDIPAPERPQPLAVRWFFCFNLPCYAGGLRIIDEADGADGLLDVTTFRSGGIRAGLRLAAAVYMRRHRRIDGFAACRARKIRLESDVPVPYQLDGDPGGHLPLDLEVLPGRLTLLTPELCGTVALGCAQ